MKFAICHELFENWDWERQCRFIAEVGYTGIELAPFTLAPRITDVSAEQRKTLKQQAADHGLQIMGLHWLLAKTEGLHVTTRDAVTRKRTSAYLRELAHACADFGGDVLVFGSPMQRNLAADMTREEGLANAAEVFREMAPVLEERQVKLCLEPLTPQETNFMMSCAEAMDLVHLVDHPQVCLHQDVKAMLSEPTPIPELIARYRPYVGHFHVNDSNLLGPGMGETDYTPIFAALLEQKYDGWVSVEVFDYKPGCEFIARRSMDYMQEVLAKFS
jgi:sugar phosphate isomerase/epimerase